MSEVGATFAACRAQKRAAFVPYLMAGDPDLATSPELLRALVAGGADLIALGVPFTDPIGDGPVLRRAAARALEAGTTLSGILRLVARRRAELGVPMVLVSYYNPILRRGVERFAEQVESSGIDALLCIDLPPEESEDLRTALGDHGVDLASTLAPQADRRRIRQVAELASGFVYYASRPGVTGVRERLPAYLPKRIKRVRRRLRLPLAVGFGLSTAEQVGVVARVADGVVVGSALVREVETHRGAADCASRLEQEVARLRAGVER